MFKKLYRILNFKKFYRVLEFKKLLEGVCWRQIGYYKINLKKSRNRWGYYAASSKTIKYLIILFYLKKSNKYNKDFLFLSQIKNTSTCLAYIICQGRGQLC